MRNTPSGTVITCHGSDLMLTVDHVSDVTVEVLSSSGTWVAVSTITTSEAVILPGHPGTQYRPTYASGTVDVHGSCSLN